MAGNGQRFKDAGYVLPKPLIDIKGKPMIQRVVENIGYKSGKFIFLVRKEHLDYIDLVTTLKRCTNDNCEIILVDKLTQGAACTALLAKNFINSSTPLLIANSDQLVLFDESKFRELQSKNKNVIFTFYATESKWSFVRLEDDYIVEVAEKKPISNIATCGLYYWDRGDHFVWSAERMIENNIRVNNEFYIAPSFNELLSYQNTVPLFVQEMIGLGTPEDLQAALPRII